MDILQNREDVKVIERVDAPTSDQIAVIWVNDDGLAPGVQGFKLYDTAGVSRQIQNWNRILDPCCFPILHPRGTFGWRCFLPKRGKENVIILHIILGFFYFYRINM